MAVDLGTANTVVYVRGQGIVLDEPSIVAINTRNQQLLAVGGEAKRMLGRTPAHIQAIRPLKDGVIADFDICEKMLRYFIQRVHQRRWAKPRMVICIPSGITGVERRAVQEAAEFAGARKPALVIEEPMAAAIGAGLPVHEPAGNMIVDIGGGTTEVAVISLGGIVASESSRIAGDEFDEAILAFMKREYSLALGERTAEEVKTKLATAYPLEEELYAEIRGRDLVTGLPKTVVVSTGGDSRSSRGTGRRDRRRGEGHARQDAARARRRHHGTRHRARRGRRAAAGARPRHPGRDRDADAGRQEPALLGGPRLGLLPRAVRRAPAGADQPPGRLNPARRRFMAVYRRESRRRPILVMVVITSLALITLDTGGNGIIASVRHTARDAIAPVQGVVDDAFNPVENVFDGVTKVRRGCAEREREAPGPDLRAREGLNQPSARVGAAGQRARAASSTCPTSKTSPAWWRG